MTTGGPPGENYPPPYPQQPNQPPQQPQQPYQPGEFVQQYPQYGQQYPYPMGYQGPQARYPYEDTSGKATTSLVLGCIGILAWCLPIIGLPVTIVGLVFGFKGLRSNNRGMAIAGIVLNIIFLVATLANAAWGAYLGATGQHPLFKR